MKTARKLVIGAALASPAAALGQVPDLLNALDAGGRAMGMGGAGYQTDSSTLSGYYNPAGLGYLDAPAAGVVFRNLPTSRTVVTGDFSNLRLDSRADTGARYLTHVGYAFPMRQGGALGVSLTTGGFVRDERLGNNLPDGALTVRNYRELSRVRNDFLAVSYGRANADSAMTWGVSLLYAMSHVVNTQAGQLVDSSNNVVGTLSARNDEQGHGFGLLVGIQLSPRNQPNTSFGLSYRTEIDLTGNENTASLYDKIPARLAAGLAHRRDGLRGGRDYLLVAADVQHFFEGGSSPLFDRDAQTVAGIGAEYNYHAAWGRLPVRLGYAFVPSGGRGYGSRNAFTYGIGYRPPGSDLALDLNFASPEGGSSDMSLSLSYRFRNR
ncbi:MAG TPA: hypothetical protein VM328_13540 [Fimbriimonadaceae bacterium]|nr:hypothetical protein [Fimbriimonadaceae bacterium]